MKKLTINSQRNSILNDTFEIQSHVGYFVDFISLTKDELAKKVKCFQNLENFFDELYTAKQTFPDSDFIFNLDQNKNCLIKLEVNNNQDKVLNIGNMYFIFNKDSYRFADIKTQQYNPYYNFENNVNQMNGFVYDKQQKEFIYCVAEKNKLQLVKDKSSIDFYMHENTRSFAFMNHKDLLCCSFSNEIQKDKNYLYRAYKMAEKNDAFVVDLVKCHLSSITYNHNEEILGVTFSEKFTQQLKRNTDKNNTVFDRMKQLENHFDIKLYNNVLEEIQVIFELKQLTQDKQVKQVSLIKPLDDIFSSCLKTTLKEEPKLNMIPDSFNQFYASVKESVFKPVEKTVFNNFYLETQPELNFDFLNSKTINQMYKYSEKVALESNAKTNTKPKRKMI